MSRLIFAEHGWDDYIYWQMQDKKTLDKINKLLKEVQRTPFKGSGKPEPLKQAEPNTWSRRINKKDRLVYVVTDDGIIIEQCKGHYEDK
ncbi:MAG: Txe/YoeB family addiction module toxin [Agathobacter sp.]|nr:Txe/YoeB family addiction module toxin [Agathobacter sp.]